MDFSRTDTQAAVAEAVAGALRTAAPAEELLTALPSRSIDDAGFDAQLWEAFAQSGLLALPLPESLGGDNLTVADIAVLLEEVGIAGAIIPAMETLGFGVAPIVALGTAEQQAELLADMADGPILTAACGEPGRLLTASPTATVTDGTLRGTVVGVRYAAQARTILVPTTSGVAAVRPDSTGVELTATLGSLGVPEYAARFDGTPVQALLGESDPQAAVATLRRLQRAAMLASADGLLTGALRLTAGYLKGREQFGRPLGAFQAVQQELADVYIVAQNMHNLSQSVNWRIAAGLADSDTAGDRYATDAQIAAWWLASEGPRAGQVMHHLHGGVGVDITYPMFRYFSAIKDLARLVGGVRVQLDAIAATLPAGTATAQPATAQPAAAVPVDGEPFIDLTESQRELQRELREYFAGLITAEEAADMATTRHGETYRAVIERMGRDGWLGVGWPTEFGGKGFGHIEQQIFTNEANRADVPLPSVTLQTVGPTLQKYGTDKQKDAFLSGILDGSVHFAIGYSEPDSGTDLASLRTTAKLDEATGDWIINGQKMWTTGGHDADYVWLAARTGTPDSRHKGLTIFIVDTNDPGYSFTPIITADGAHHVNATYYQDVRVPGDMVVGEVNGGWKMLTTQLNHERVMLAPAGRLGLYLDKLLGWAQRPGVDGTAPLDHRDVATGIAEVAALYRVNELLNWQVGASGDDPSMADSAASKVFATERVQQAGRIFEELLGRFGDPTNPEDAALARWLDMMIKRNVVITFGGGVNEVMRELVCMGGLGMPRTAR